jgi:hypothetical protein
MVASSNITITTMNMPAMMKATPSSTNVLGALHEEPALWPTRLALASCQIALGAELLACDERCRGTAEVLRVGYRGAVGAVDAEDWLVAGSRLSTMSLSARACEGWGALYRPSWLLGYSHPPAHRSLPLGALS